MVRLRAAAAIIALACCVVTPALAQTPTRAQLPTYAPPPVTTHEARLLRTYEAPEARQGVAVDGRYFYAVVNTTIAKYDKASGERLARWSGPRGGLVSHINACFAEADALWCANSNFPETPMASSIEVFNAEDLSHRNSHSLGILDEGSLTFIDRYRDGWLAGFAHYDDVGGLAYKGAVFAGLTLYDAQWRRTGGYAFPKSVLAAMAPHAASGGAFGPDGLLYVFGHSKPEMYVLAKPVMGPTLIHIATIAIDARGQAFDWDETQARVLFAIDRPTGTVRSFAIPEIKLDHSPDARRFVDPR
ncbi:MAG: hypothetical protein SF069_05330 [Phycisphaerae bacterium]|nr:hypothetical protein [Phycisphaerae bacterium]